MGSCERIRREHVVIEEVLAGVESALGRLAQGREMPAAFLAGAVEFFATFVARCHEAKEEQALFPLLERRGVPAETLEALRRQHAEGHRLLALLRPLSTRLHIDAEGARLFGEYVRLARAHVAFESEILFPMAETVLTVEDDEALEAAFDGIERALGGPSGCETMLSLGRALNHASRSLAEERGSRAVQARDVVRRSGVVTPTDTLARAEALMESLGARELAVVERGALVGLVTRTDLDPHRGHLEWTPVRAAMTPDPISVAPDAPVSSVARLLVERGFNAVPVTTDGALVGIIRRSDLLPLLDEGAGRAARRPRA